MWGRRAGAAAALALVPVAAAALAEEQRGYDFVRGVALRLDGRQLKVTARRPQSARRLSGHVVRAVCSTDYDTHGKVAIGEAWWRVGARSRTITLETQLRRPIRWCLLERGEAADFANAPLAPKPGQLRVRTRIDEVAASVVVLTYLRLRDADGELVMRDESSRSVRIIPAGRYRLRAWQRTCSRTCKRLSPPGEPCVQDVRIRPRRTTYVQIQVRADDSGCEMQQQ